VGSAASLVELSRLRIKKDVASTQLGPESITEIDSDSIEAGLMTLVLKGNAFYFQGNTGIQGVSLELEDVITIHMMEDDGSAADDQDDGTSASDFVMGLLAASPDDNSNTNGLLRLTAGYALNGVRAQRAAPARVLDQPRVRVDAHADGWPKPLHGFAEDLPLRPHLPR